MAAWTLPDDEIVAISRIEDLVPLPMLFAATFMKLLLILFLTRSRPSRQFLEYVVERSLKRESDQLKNRRIGIHLFGRDPCYDKTEDAIVRVTAAEVRRRLLQFYAEPGRQASF
jgi:hypothetical protein